MNRIAIVSINVMAILLLVCVEFCTVIVAQINDASCPQISIRSPNEVFFPGQTSTIKALINGPLPDNSHLFWGTSRGRIISGGGTTEIKVLFENGDGGYNIAAFVRIENLPPNCLNTFSEIFSVAQLPIVEHPEEFGELKPDDVKARIDNFFVVINNNPTSEGLIVASLDKKQSNSRKLQGLRFIFDAVKFRKYDVTRLSFLVKESEVGTSFALRLFKPGDDLPDDLEKINLLKGEDLIKNLRKALPKRACNCPSESK